MSKSNLSFIIAFGLLLFIGNNEIDATFVRNSQVNTVRSKTVSLNNIFDDLKLIFSEEGRANRQAYEERERDAMEAKQQEIIARRRNPEVLCYSFCHTFYFLCAHAFNSNLTTSFTSTILWYGFVFT